MDVIARLPDCNGQAADAVSAYTQVKLEDAPRLLKNRKSECPDVLHKWPKSWANIEDPVVPLERHCTVIYEQDCHGRDNTQKFYWNLDGKSTKLGKYVCSSETRVISVSIRG